MMQPVKTGLPIVLSPQLAADGARVEEIGLSVLVREQTVLLVREEFELLLWTSAGKEPLDTERLAYTLFGADGEVLSEGTIGPPTRIAAGQTLSTTITDDHLPQAIRIEVRKLP